MTAKKRPELYDATGRPYQKKAKTLMLFFEIPFENPRKQLDPRLPIGEITAMDIREFMEKKPEDKYDLIATINSMQCLSAREVPDFLAMINPRLTYKGELIAVAPSFEWAAAYAAAPQPHPLLHQLLLGTPKTPHRCVLTLSWMRQLIAHAQLHVVYATEEAYQPTIDGTKYTLVRNMVIGRKYEEYDASTALDSDIAVS